MLTPVRVKLRIPGFDESPNAGERAHGRTGDATGQTRLGVTTKVLKAVRIEAARGEATPEQLEAAGDNVIELTLEGGARIFLRADEAELRLKDASKRSLAFPGTVEIAPALSIEGVQARGVVTNWAIKSLRVLGVDLPESSALLVAAKADAHCVPAPGLFRWKENAVLEPVQSPLVGAGPWLVFLHGTASSTMGSFGQLAANTAHWDQLRRRYGDRILALEHHTLTRGPIGNALELVEQLPDNVRLHLVSHSRGGLIGELIARGQRLDAEGRPAHPFDAHDRLLLQGPERRSQLARLDALAAVLQAKRPVVERFVRVACPVRGTTLASARLDQWLNLFLNVLGLAADIVGTPALGTAHEAVETFLLAVLKERTDPRTIPGLEAMIPGSPLVAMLNRPDVRTAADLSVIEGDAVPSGVLRRLGIWFADAFYGEEHDLIVNRASMTGGAARLKPRSFFDQGAAVNHFSYFKNPRTADRVLAGLLRKDAELGGFREIGPELDAAARSRMPTLRNRGAADARPVVYVLPGIAGSHLEAGADRVWINPLRLAFGGLAKLGIDRPHVQAKELVGLYYGALCEHLDRTHEVRPWAFDWRQPILDLGVRFGQELSRAFRETERPVRIVAHSMGGLVARSALLEASVWTRFRERDTSRLIQLGTPNGGSFSIAALLMGRNTLAGYLHAIDVRMTAREQLEILGRFPGAIQMLPENNGSDLFDLETWTELARTDPDDLDWPVPDRADLTAARMFRSAYAKAPIDCERMLYVAGQAATMDGITFDPLGRPGERIVFTRTNEGDGEVLWGTGIPAGIRAWYSTAAHGDLARHKPNFAAIEDLLTTGTTTRLPTNPPASVRSRPKPPSIVRDEIKIQPDAEDFALAALGGTPARQADAMLPMVRVRVVHGHLASAKYPVMVGHYCGDTFAGAEAELDQALGLRLSERRRLGLYAGPIVTSTVVLDEGSQPRGGIVVGLGNPGSLSTGTLVRTMRQAILAYAAATADGRRLATVARFGYCDKLAAEPLGISTLLIGSGEVGLDRTSALLALFSAAARAQSILAEEEGSPTVLDEIEIVELIEDQAYDIWHTVRELLASRLELGQMFEVSGDVKRMPGATRRVSVGQDRSRWLPVQITMPELERGDRTLAFTIAGGLARAEARVIAANLDVVEPLIRRAIDNASASTTNVTPGRALFELLWPVTLKEHSGEERNLRLILDERSAQLPWELMDDRRPWTADASLPERGDRKPPAVRSGVMRQLVQTTFREQVTIPRGTRKALVIGDPRGTPMTGFAKLPGAEREAKAVADRLSRTHEVTSLIGDGVTPEHVMMHLFAEAWEIVHIAAHGVVSEALPGPDGSVRRVTGVVLGGGVVLGPKILAQLSVSPSLFFVNCCYLGQVDPTAEEAARAATLRGGRPELAASVAVELIRCGVRGVVAAGWAVDDEAAEAFAISFYDGLLKGVPFGAAVRVAREVAHDLKPTSNTWGAYQCYGEPDWQLPGLASGNDRGRTSKVYAAAAEAVAVAERIREDVTIGLKHNVETLRTQLCEIESYEKARQWFGNGELRVALGEARAALGDLPAAIEHYEAARRGADTEYKVKAIEQLAHLRAWQTTRLFRRMPPDPQKAGNAISEIEEARDLVHALARSLGDTQERWALRGSCWQRLAQVQGTDLKNRSLGQMARCYRCASKVAWPERNRALLMACAARIVLRCRRGLSEIPSVRAALTDIIGASVADEADFMQRILALDARVLLAVSDGRITAEEEADILGAYIRAWRRGGSPVMLMAALEQFEFLEDVLPQDGVPESNPMVETVRRLRETLEARFMGVEHDR